MTYKKVVLLFGIIAIITVLFFVSSWTNAMVVSDTEIPLGAEIASRMAPAIVGLFTVIASAVLILLAHEHKS